MAHARTMRWKLARRALAAFAVAGLAAAAVVGPNEGWVGPDSGSSAESDFAVAAGQRGAPLTPTH